MYWLVINSNALNSCTTTVMLQIMYNQDLKNVTKAVMGWSFLACCIKLLPHSISCVCLICQISIFLSLLSEWFIQCKEFEVCCFLFFKWTNVRDFLALFDEYLNNFFRKWRQIWQAISLITTSDYYTRIFRFMRM